MTLIHAIPLPNRSDNTQLIKEAKSYYGDRIGVISLRNRNHQYLVLKRPYLEEFLKELSPYFLFSVSTMATQEYAEEVLKFIDPWNENGLCDRVISYGG